MRKASPIMPPASAFAQCNVHRYNVPDFDQKRFGVDNTGNMYCVPTSSLNWMAYIANHGDSSLMGGSSGNWASSSVYNRVTARLNEMGAESDTSGTGGTNLSDAVEGIADYMDSHGVNGYYIICGYKADDDWAPSPKSFYNHMKAGYLVNLCFGRYDLNGGEWERDGGHCMTVVKVDNACGTNPVVGFAAGASRERSWSSDSQTPRTELLGDYGDRRPRRRRNDSQFGGWRG